MRRSRSRGSHRGAAHRNRRRLSCRCGCQFCLGCRCWSRIRFRGTLPESEARAPVIVDRRSFLVRALSSWGGLVPARIFPQLEPALRYRSWPCYPGCQRLRLPIRKLYCRVRRATQSGPCLLLGATTTLRVLCAHGLCPKKVADREPKHENDGNVEEMGQGHESPAYSDGLGAGD